MKLDKIQLINYRNITNQTLIFDEGIQVFYGANAQGKTNLLEAIYYLSTLRSHRSNNILDLINKQSDELFIQGEVNWQNKKIPLRIHANAKGKNLFIYQNKVKKMSDFIGNLNAILFSPDDMNLFCASPKIRRRFIDIELSKISKKYTYTLHETNQLLKERNIVLKQDKIDETYLQVLTERLIDLEVIIIKQRYHFLKALLAKSSKFYEAISANDTKLSINYKSCIPYEEDEQALKAKLKLKYEQSYRKDCLYKTTNIGIHKEDFIFLIDDYEVVQYASQGQKRSILLAIKIAMVYLIKDFINEYPLLLLDDVFSELDAYRRKMLLSSLPKEVQIFITTTDHQEILEIAQMRPITLWKVNKGCVGKYKEEVHK